MGFSPLWEINISTWNLTATPEPQASPSPLVQIPTSHCACLQVLPSAANRHGLRCWGFGVVLAFVANTCFATALQTSAHPAYLSGTVLNLGMTYYIHPAENVQATSNHLFFLPTRAPQRRHLTSHSSMELRDTKAKYKYASVRKPPEKSFLCVKTISYVNPTKALGIYPFPDCGVFRSQHCLRAEETFNLYHLIH